jgi:type II secretory pathway component PulF
MQRFADLAAAGQPTGTAARASELGEVASVALSSRTGPGLDAALRFAADYYRALHARSWLIVRTLALPAMVMTLGLLVGGLVYAVFVPLVVLINAAMIW